MTPSPVADLAFGVVVALRSTGPAPPRAPVGSDPSSEPGSADPRGPLVVVIGDSSSAPRGGQVRVDFPRASLVVQSNFASGYPSADGERLARRLGTAAVESGAAYVDVTDFLTESDTAPDGVDPTEQGQAQIAERIDGELRGAAQP